MTGVELDAAAIAERYEISERQARRWLLATEAKYGASVVGRRGRHMFTTLAAFEAVAPRAMGDRKYLAELDERQTDTEKRQDAMSTELAKVKRELNDLQFKSMMWFRRLGEHLENDGK